jgi:cytochrome P450
MSNATEMSYRTELRAIPHLDPPLFLQPTTSENGLERIILPSGHIAYHIKRYHEVQDVLMDRRFVRSPSNEEGAASVFPTLTPRELLLNNDHPSHARLKSLVSKDFSPTGVAEIRPFTVKTINDRLDWMARRGGEADLYRDLLDHVPSTVICDFLGLDPADMEYFRPLSRTVQIAARDDIPELVRQFERVYQYLVDLVQNKRPSRPSGYIQRLLNARGNVDPAFSDAELVGVLIGALLGGDQNLLTMMSKVIYSLLAAPALFAQLVEEPETIPDAMEELFRLIPLGMISAFPRIASRDLDMDWGRIPCGAALYPDVFAANRDPAVYESPLEIRFDRKTRRHLQFGYGMHSCMGAALTRMEVTTVVETLVARAPTLRLSASPSTIPWQEGLLSHRPTALPVKWNNIL